MRICTCYYGMAQDSSWAENDDPNLNGKPGPTSEEMLSSQCFKHWQGFLIFFLIFHSMGNYWLRHGEVV